MEDAPRNAHHTLIFANTDAELDDRALRVQRASGGKRKNINFLERSANVRMNMPWDGSQ